VKRRVPVTLAAPGPRRPIVALDQLSPLGQCFHQAATGGLRQPALTGNAIYEMVAEQARLAEEALRRRAVRRAREAADMRSFAES